MATNYQDLLLVVFTLYPDGPGLQNDENVDFRMPALKKLAQEQMSAFFDSSIRLVIANKPTMVLMAHEVEQLRELFSDALTSQKRVAKIPSRFESYGLVFPSRLYMAANLSSLSNTQVEKLRSTLDEDVNGFKCGAFHKLNDDELSNWSNQTNSDLKEVNWFVELNTVDIEKA